MADYIDIRNEFDNADLLGMIEVAIIVKANSILEGTPTAEDRAWMFDVLDSLRKEANKILMLLLGGNSGLTIEQIRGVDSGNIQTKVNAIVPSLIAAKAGL